MLFALLGSCFGLEIAPRAKNESTQLVSAADSTLMGSWPHQLLPLLFLVDLLVQRLNHSPDHNTMALGGP